MVDGKLIIYNNSYVPTGHKTPYTEMTMFEGLCKFGAATMDDVLERSMSSDLNSFTKVY